MAVLAGRDESLDHLCVLEVAELIQLRQPEIEACKVAIRLVIRISS